MSIRDLIHMIFGRAGEVPKNPKLFRQEKPSKHWGSKKKFNRTKARLKDKKTKASRKRNRIGR